MRGGSVRARWRAVRDGLGLLAAIAVLIAMAWAAMAPIEPAFARRAVRDPARHLGPPMAGDKVESCPTRSA
jgi:hypothetical protein